MACSSNPEAQRSAYSASLIPPPLGEGLAGRHSKFEASSNLQARLLRLCPHPPWLHHDPTSMRTVRGHNVTGGAYLRGLASCIPISGLALMRRRRWFVFRSHSQQPSLFQYPSHISYLLKHKRLGHIQVVGQVDHDHRINTSKRDS